MNDTVRSTPDAALRQVQSLSAADQLWVIHQMAEDLSTAAVFAEDPPKGEFLFVAAHPHSVVSEEGLHLCIHDMSALDHGASSILLPGNQDPDDCPVFRGKRMLPYSVTGYHHSRLSTFAQADAFTDALSRFQNNLDFVDIEDPATTIVWLKRNIDAGDVPSEPEAPARDDAVSQPPQEGDER